MAAKSNFTLRSFAFPVRAGFGGISSPFMAVADFNGDGNLDVYAAYYGPNDGLNQVGTPGLLLLGNGSGNLADGTKTVFQNGAPLGYHPRELIVADFNGDNRADVYIADHGYDANPFPGAQNGLILSSGMSQMANATANLPQQLDFTHSASAGDVNGDGFVDLIAGNLGKTDPYLLINDGTGHFTKTTAGLPAEIASPAPSTPGNTKYLLFDANGDGHPDLLAATIDTRTGFVRIYANDGQGGFAGVLSSLAIPTAPIPVPGVASVQAVEAKAFDFTGDGSQDLALIYTDYDQTRVVALYVNDGHGNFIDDTARRLPVFQSHVWPVRLNFVDMNGDGFVDILAMNGTTGPILLNDGNGFFHQLPNLFPDKSTDAYFPGDFNNDGRMDLAIYQGTSPQSDYYALALAVDTPAEQTGDASDNGIMGDNGNETLSGLDGNDVIFGAGGTDHLDGGSGADYLNGGSGADALMGGAGDDAIDGGAGNDVLTGGGGSDVLDGGKGADRLEGGDGSDIYIVDNAGDVIIEASGQGTDTVKSSVSATLSANLENLTLMGTASIGATGNDLANEITGNSGANALVGGGGNDILTGNGGKDVLDGGKGADRMQGGTGNDIYIVDNSSDVIIEASGQGTDIVKTTVSASLSANVEHLTLLGSASINATGNDLANKITGNNGANRLVGGGGADTINGGAGNDSLFGGTGKDLLTGGTGQDFFVFNTAPGAANVDRITDFSKAEGDNIQLRQAAFKAFGYTGTLHADDFFAAAGATKAHDATDRLVYNTTTGALYYDADGLGGGAAVQIALLGALTHPALVYGDLQIIA